MPFQPIKPLCKLNRFSCPPLSTIYAIHAGISFPLHPSTAAAPQTHLKILHNNLPPINQHWFPLPRFFCLTRHLDFKRAIQIPPFQRAYRSPYPCFIETTSGTFTQLIFARKHTHYEHRSAALSSCLAQYSRDGAFKAFSSAEPA